MVAVHHAESSQWAEGLPTYSRQAEEGRCGFEGVAVSKTDPEALGKYRLHGCCCEQGGCPVAAARDLKDHALQSGRSGAEWFAVLSMNYQQAPKHEMQLCIVDAAKELRVDGRITAHALRATAAQGNQCRHGVVAGAVVLTMG